MVILAIGVSPQTTLSKDSGLEPGINGSIVVNDRCLIESTTDCGMDRR